MIPFSDSLSSVFFLLNFADCRGRRLSIDRDLDVKAEEVPVGDVCRHSGTGRRRHELPIRRESNHPLARRPGRPHFCFLRSYWTGKCISQEKAR